MFVLEDLNFNLNVLWTLEYLTETQDTGLEIFTTSCLTHEWKNVLLRKVFGQHNIAKTSFSILTTTTTKRGNKITTHRYWEPVILLAPHKDDFPIQGHSQQADDSSRVIYRPTPPPRTEYITPSLIPWGNSHLDSDSFHLNKFRRKETKFSALYLHIIIL